ncbi:MAG TPA: hypothetical protein VFR51_17355 [Pyrinomonadaceae bacterium]|nr:hypothetical protein [Pyrinomonadaceae bacterium]
MSLTIVFALMSGACAAFRPTDTAGPRTDVRLYPVALVDPATRLEETSLAWYQISQHYGLQRRTEAHLDPYTATLQSIPPELAASIQLPKVGDDPQTEEQTRESLRRFIAEWQRLIGASPQELSLVERTDDATGAKLARYEQRPFRYPLRGAFGKLEIRFRNDRRLVSLSSNCLPDADRLQTALNQISPEVTAEEAVTRVKSQPISVPGANGQQQTITLPDTAVLAPGQLVVYALPPPNQTPVQTSGTSGGLELHLAWEINVTNGPIKTIYFDAVSSQVIAAT